MTASRDALLALADRVEAATGADRELDAAICRVSKLATEQPDGTWITYFEGGWRHSIDPTQVTASLDAAMALVPGDADAMGERFRLEAYNSPGVLAPHVRASAWVAGAPRVYAATPALALTAAALRALAETLPQEDV